MNKSSIRVETTEQKQIVPEMKSQRPQRLTVEQRKLLREERSNPNSLIPYYLRKCKNILRKKVEVCFTYTTDSFTIPRITVRYPESKIENNVEVSCIKVLDIQEVLNMPVTRKSQEVDLQARIQTRLNLNLGLKDLNAEQLRIIHMTRKEFWVFRKNAKTSQEQNKVVEMVEKTPNQTRSKVSRGQDPKGQVIDTNERSETPADTAETQNNTVINKENCEKREASILATNNQQVVDSLSVETEEEEEGSANPASHSKE